MEAIRSLFTSLEFRTLYERLEDIGRGAKPSAEVAELDLREVTVKEIGSLLAATGPKAVRLDADGRWVRGVAVSVGGGQAAYAETKDLGGVAEPLGDPGAAKWTHDAKDLETAAIASGAELAGVTFDTMLAGYLLGSGGALVQPFRALPALCGLGPARVGDV